MINKKPIIMFDGVCNFCNFWVNFIIDKDKKENLKLAALQSEQGQLLLKKFNLPTEDFDTFILVENEKYYSKSTAALRIAKHLGGMWKTALILYIIPRFIRDFLYSLIAKNRYSLFGKTESCRIPTESERKRFDLKD